MRKELHASMSAVLKMSIIDFIILKSNERSFLALRKQNFIKIYGQIWDKGPNVDGRWNGRAYIFFKRYITKKYFPIFPYGTPGVAIGT